MSDDELVDKKEIGNILRIVYGRVNYLTLHDPFFPEHVKMVFKKNTGKRYPRWRRSDIERYKAERILRHPEYRAHLRKIGEPVPASELPTAILTIDELRDERDRLLKVVSELSNLT